MKYKNVLLCVKDISVSERFYREVLGLRKVADFGANITLTGGVCLQTEQTWREFVNGAPVAFGANCCELYFEEENFDGFIEKLKAVPSLRYVHPVREHRWGQRVVRFYDPDSHIVEVGECMEKVAERFAESGMDIPQIAARMDVAESYVRRLLGKRTVQK